MAVKKEITYEELVAAVGKARADKIWGKVEKQQEGVQLKRHQIEAAGKVIDTGTAGAASSAALPVFKKYFSENPRAKTSFKDWLSEQDKTVADKPGASSEPPPSEPAE